MVMVTVESCDPRVLLCSKLEGVGRAKEDSHTHTHTHTHTRLCALDCARSFHSLSLSLSLSKPNPPSNEQPCRSELRRKLCPLDPIFQKGFKSPHTLYSKSLEKNCLI